MDTTTMSSTYELVHFDIKSKGRELLLMNAKANQVWDFHVPPNHRLFEPNISFNQSPSCHIPSVNVRLITKTK